MSTVNKSDYDLIIVGGGLVGASLAISLAEQDCRIALIEASAFRSEQLPSYDDRAIALSFGSRRIFEGMGLWPVLAKKVTPIKRIHVSDQGRFGFTRLDCDEENVDALGYVITARELGMSLLARLDEYVNSVHNDKLTLMSPASVTGITLADDQARLTINHEGKSETLSSKLIVAADGGQSSIRQQLGIDTEERDYQQTAVIANLSPGRPHQGVAYERFTTQGPMALLPLSPQDNEDRCALVWTREPKDAERIMTLDDATFLAEAQACFGQRLGRFTKIGQRHAYPLTLIRAGEQVRARLALIGNAAHTLHPIAGQGFNLGLRDVATLAQAILDAHRANQDIGALQVLEPYAQWRARDQHQVIGFTHFLVESFSTRFLPLAVARNLSLLATDILPPVKHTLARHAMGLAGKLPRLARGLPL